jgi:di/tricarboxylate transporter
MGDESSEPREGILHQTDSHVFGAGRYRFMDFQRVGVWLNFILWITASVLIPIFWPFVEKP